MVVIYKVSFVINANDDADSKLDAMLNIKSDWDLFKTSQSLFTQDSADQPRVNSRLKRLALQSKCYCR